MLVFISTYPCDENDREFIYKLYLDFERLMYATAKRYISDHLACEDIVQDSIEKLIKKINTLRSMERCVLGGYIVSTIRNTAINYLKRKGMEHEYYGGNVDFLEVEIHLSGKPSPDEVIILTEQKERIQKIWEVLTEEERFLLEGKYILGMTDQELGLQIGCKPDSIRMKLTRARRAALKTMINQEGAFHDQT